MREKNNTKKIAFAGLLTALALIFSYIEALIPLLLRYRALNWASPISL